MTSTPLKAIATLALVAVAALAGLMAWSRMQKDIGAPAPLHPSSALTAALMAACEPDKSCAPSLVKSLGTDVLRTSPTSALPFIFAATATAKQSGWSDAAVRAFLRRALARQPRAVLPRLMQADAELRAGDAAASLHSIERLLAITQDDQTYLHAALADIAFLPGGADALEARIATTAPPWRHAVINALVKRDFDPLTLVRWAKDSPDDQRNVVNAAIAKYGPEIGFLVWQETLSVAEARAFAWPYDGYFKGLSAPSPFNWNLAQSGAEREAGGGLSIYYSGRGQVTLAEQLMVIGPGAFTLTSQASGEANLNGGRLIWTLSCAADGQPLAELPLRGLKAGMSVFSAPLTVPENCGVQRLVLHGAPGEFPASLRATIRTITVSPGSKAAPVPSAPGAAP